MSGAKITLLKMWDATSISISTMALIQSNRIEYIVYEKGVKTENIWDKYV